MSVKYKREWFTSSKSLIFDEGKRATLASVFSAVQFIHGGSSRGIQTLTACR